MTTQTDQRDCCDTVRPNVHAPDCPRRTLAQTIAESTSQQIRIGPTGPDISVGVPQCLRCGGTGHPGMPCPRDLMSTATMEPGSPAARVAVARSQIIDVARHLTPLSGYGVSDHTVHRVLTAVLDAIDALQDLTELPPNVGSTL